MTLVRIWEKRRGVIYDLFEEAGRQGSSALSAPSVPGGSLSRALVPAQMLFAFVADNCQVDRDLRTRFFRRAATIAPGGRDPPRTLQRPCSQPRAHPDTAPVAQVSNLPYRGFPTRRRCVIPTVCRLEVGETAGWKPALRVAEARRVGAVSGCAPQPLGSILSNCGSWPLTALRRNLRAFEERT